MNNPALISLLQSMNDEQTRACLANHREVKNVARVLRQSVELVSTDIATRIPAMKEDSPINNAAVISGLIRNALGL